MNIVRNKSGSMPLTESASRYVVLLAVVLALPCQLFAGDWPQWRGPNRDGHLLDEKLPETLPGQPTIVWRKSIKHGYAAPVISGSKLVFLDDDSDKETIHCLDAATGKTLWSKPFAPTYSDEFEPGPRCTPLIDGDRIYVQSCKGEFQCLDLADGNLRWRFNFDDYGTFWVPDRQSGVGAANRRGNTGSGIVDGDRIFVQVGSTNGACIVAFEKRSGKLVWKSQDDLTCYSSLACGTLGGLRQVVAATCEGLLGLATDDGRPLWRVRFKTGANRNVLTPILDGDCVTFASYTTGLQRQRISTSNTTQTASEAWMNRELKI